MFSFLKAVVTNSPMGRVYAQTSKEYYVAGELIQGNIIVEAIAPLQANGIDLTVSGYEKTEWHDRTSREEIITPSYTDSQGHHVPARTRTIPQLKRHRAKKTFFNQVLRIYNIGGGMLAPGTYTYPFQYQLPEGIPGSFYERTNADLSDIQEFIDQDGIDSNSWYDSDDEYDGFKSTGANTYRRSALLATIMYKLKVTLDIHGLFTAVTGIEDMNCKVPLVIHPKLDVALRPAMQEFTQDVIVCCCINRGKCTVCARFDKLAYVAGETADVRCDITNDSKSDLKTRVILKRYLTLKSTQGSKNLNEEIATQQYEVVKGKEAAKDRPMPLKLDGPKVKPTTNGGFVTCNYEYLVECEVSMGTDINLKMPLTIYAPQPPPMQPFVATSSPPMQMAQALPPMQQQFASPPPQQFASQPPPQQQQMGYAPQQQYPGSPTNGQILVQPAPMGGLPQGQYVVVGQVR